MIRNFAASIRALGALLFVTSVGVGSAHAAESAATATPASGSAASGPAPTAECISPEAKKALSECPKGAMKSEGHRRTGTAFKSKPPPRERNTEKDFKPGDVSQLDQFAQRDTRKGKMQARARALLITEITGLERLYNQTPKTSPDRPQLILRLAEAYAELEQAAQRDKIQADIKLQDAKKKKADTASLRQEIAKAKQMEAAARGKAISYYKRMAAWYAKYSKIDEVLYYLAYEYEQAGDLKSARTTYFELISKAPKSPYIPNAYLAFGELFFQDATADPSKWPLAEQAYKEVLKHPPPVNKLWGFAHYKLGYVYWNQGIYNKALDEFKEVIKFGTTFSNLPNAAQLAKSARRDLIPVYAASEQPERAYNYFKPLSGDAGGSDDKTIGMMRDLGFSYLDTGHYDQAIRLYQNLMSKDRGEFWCTYQSSITKAVQAAFSGDKPRIVKELDNQIRARKEFAGMKVPADKALACDNETAGLLAETAMSWHLEAVGTGGVRGTGDEKTMDLAADLYKRVVDNFTNEDFAKYEFPRIVKEDWPTLYKIRYAMADLLYFRKRWEECGPAFDAVVDANPTGPDAPEAAYAAVLCYQKMYDQMYQGKSDRATKGLGPKGASEEDRKTSESEWEKFKPKEFTSMQKGMVSAFNRYVCYITPKEGDAEAKEQYIDVKYARARTYFEAQHWEEAALGFRDIALNHSDNDAGIFAAQLYLEALNVLGAKGGKLGCFDAMAEDVPAFLKNYCEGADFEENKEQCELLTRIQFDVQRLAAQKKVELADSQADKGEYLKARDNYIAGAEAYLKLWREYCEERMSKGDPGKQCEKAHEIVYNMARAYQAGRLLAKSIQARMILISEKYGMNKTDLAMTAIYEIGGNYQAIAVYDKAAQFYETYADKVGYKGDKAVQALSDAVVLRLGLGDETKALEDADTFKRKFGSAKAKEAAQVAFAIAANYGANGKWDDVRKSLYGATLGLIDRSAALDVRMQAHALMARAYVNLKTGASAKTEYRKVIGLWSDPAAGEKAITAAGGGTRELGRALEAVGEALFYFAQEEKVAKVDALKFPEYKGQKDKEGITKHIATKVTDWFTKKKTAVMTVSGEYKKVIDLMPEPPPRWVIAAGSEVGNMWGTFVKEFRSAPIPKEWEKDYEIRTAYYGSLDDASEPFKQQAKGAYQVCLGYSVKYQYFDQYSRACEEWLASNYKAEFHLVDEFRGAPDKVNNPLDERAHPLALGGTPFVIQMDMSEEEKAKMKADAEAAQDSGAKK